MPSTSYYTKRRIITLREMGKRQNQILSQLKSEGISITRQTVCAIIKRYQVTGTLNDKQRSGRRRSMTLEYLDFIDKEMRGNDELTSVDLQRLLYDQFGKRFGVSTIKRGRRSLGWVKTGPKYCQQVKEKNRVERLEFAQRVNADKDKFENVVFTDESSVWMEKHGKLCFRKIGEPAKMKPTVKHPYKVHVWAGISKRGATDILMFTGIMKKGFYVTEILQNTLLPFLQNTYPDGHRFQQDNDPKHKSKHAMEFIKTSNINYWPTPAESPDLNPIENLWHELKSFLRKTVKPKTKEELVQGISDFWKSRVNRSKCIKYIDHLKKVVPAVIEREGRASGY